MEQLAVILSLLRRLFARRVAHPKRAGMPTERNITTITLA